MTKVGTGHPILWLILLACVIAGIGIVFLVEDRRQRQKAIDAEEVSAWERWISGAKEEE